jgi:hypothetical protein
MFSPLSRRDARKRIARAGTKEVLKQSLIQSQENWLSGKLFFVEKGLFLWFLVVACVYVSFLQN